MASGVDSSHGLFLTGEYLGVKREPGRARDEKDPSKGHWPDRFKVGIRVGPDVFDVEYASIDAAADAVQGAEKNSTVRVGVRARSAKGYTFWVGQDEAVAAGDYE